MKGSRKMEIALITVIVILAVVISGSACIVSSKCEDITKISDLKTELEDEQAKCNRYRETLDGFIERHNTLKEKLKEKDKLIAELTHQADRANELIGALEAELFDLEPMTEKEQKSRLPEGHTNMFMGMPHWKITDKTSDQYTLQQKCVTSKWSGIRVYHDDDGEYYYCAALGTAYGIDIGDTWKVTLRNGNEFNVILAEYKHDITDPDPNDFGDSCVNYISDDFCTNVIEFIYDKEHIPTKVMSAGTFSVLDFFGGITGDGGDIMKMEYLGRVWKR